MPEPGREQGGKLLLGEDEKIGWCGPKKVRAGAFKHYRKRLYKPGTNHQSMWSPNVAEIEIYTSPFCGFCHAAKRLLDKKGVAYREIDVMMKPAKRKEMTERSGSGTVPQIFVDGEHLGDCMEIMEMDEDGELDSRLGL